MNRILLFIFSLLISFQSYGQRMAIELIVQYNKLNRVTKSCQIRASSKQSLTEFPFKNEYFAGNKKDAHCSQFISNKDPGKLGPNGLILSSLMKKYPQFTENNPTEDMRQICPLFNNFSKEQRLHFWVWFWGALSLDESNCGSNMTAQGVTSVAVGDFQMEGPVSQRRSAGRPKPECFPAGSMIDFKNNATCAVAIMDQQFRNKKKLFGVVTYWQKLRRSSGSVYTLLKKYPGCN